MRTELLAPLILHTELKLFHKNQKLPGSELLCTYNNNISDDPDSVLLLTTQGFLSESSHILLSL